MTTPPRGTGEELQAETDAAFVDVAQGIKALYDERQAIFLALNPECPAFPGIPNTCNESVCDCFAAEDLAGQVTALRARLAAAEREWAATVNAAKFDAETHAKDLISERRAGAEAALRWAAANRRARQEDNETFRTRGISALFPVRPIPPPGAEVGRG